MKPSKATEQLAWPRCTCGHIAQAHNQIQFHDCRGPHDYGCDECGCKGYAFPANTTQELKNALYAQQAALTKPAADKPDAPQPSDLNWFKDPDNGAELCVEVVNTSREFKWRLIVNSCASDWTKHYQGILTHMGYAVCTAYWEGSLPIRELVPFKIGAPMPRAEGIKHGEV